MRRIFLLSCYLIISTVVMYSCSSEDGSLNSKEVEDISITGNLPIYGGAMDVKHADRDKEAHYVSYKVKIPFNSKYKPEVLKFYESEMEKLGYEPFVEEYYAYNDREWSRYIDATKEGKPHVMSLSASWADKNHKRRAILGLRYYWYPESGDPYVELGFNDDLNVSFQIIPFMTLPAPVNVR